MANGDIKRWSGSAWVSIALKHYLAGWQPTVGKRYNGSSWDQIWPAGVVTLSGEDVYDSQLDKTAVAGIRVNADGTIDRYTEFTGFVQIDSGTDWIIPNGAADSTYDVRVTNVVGDPFTTDPVADDVWINLGSARTWTIQDPNSAAGFKLVTFDLEIRKDGGAPLASTEYSLKAEYEGI